MAGEKEGQTERDVEERAVGRWRIRTSAPPHASAALEGLQAGLSAMYEAKRGVWCTSVEEKGFIVVPSHSNAQRPATARRRTACFVRELPCFLRPTGGGSCCFSSIKAGGRVKVGEGGNLSRRSFSFGCFARFCEISLLLLAPSTLQLQQPCPAASASFRPSLVLLHFPFNDGDRFRSTRHAGRWE